MSSRDFMALCRALAENGRRRAPVPRETAGDSTSAGALTSDSSGTAAGFVASVTGAGTSVEDDEPFPFFLEGLVVVEALPLREDAFPDAEEPSEVAEDLGRAPLEDVCLESSVLESCVLEAVDADSAGSSCACSGSSV